MVKESLQVSVRVSNADLLEALRQSLHRQIVRGRHQAVQDVLDRLGFVDWVRQPERESRYLVANASRAGAYIPPVDIAVLTPAGHTALDRLTALERTAGWEQRRLQPYGESVKVPP